MRCYFLEAVDSIYGTLIFPYPYCLDHEDTIEYDEFYRWCNSQSIDAVYGKHLAFMSDEDRMLFIMSYT